VGRRLKLVYLYAEKESSKMARAAMRWLHYYLDEKEPTLTNFAKVVPSRSASDTSDAGCVQSACNRS
jgi:hypothetical protein